MRGSGSDPLIERKLLFPAGCHEGLRPTCGRPIDILGQTVRVARRGGAVARELTDRPAAADTTSDA